MFDIIPAVDILDGKCVRLFQGKFDAETVYSNSPLEAAQRWVALGAKWMHLVDLNGAKTGFQENLEVIREIVESFKINFEVSGGVRTIETIEFLLACGAKRVIIGTRSVIDKHFVKSITAKFGGKIAVGVDASGGRVATDGWTHVTDIEAKTFAKDLQDMGVKKIIFTDTSRDGALKGPNFEAIEDLANSIQIPMIASGGITSIDDIKRLKNIDGVEGCIIGKALYEGKISLEDALKIQ
ncbi:MAG: 1-(5-phosphoribosyl)-5-[(5-phosphoribosylamino)methylideneamino]imidazole-4-carboxamide isomerase [bacterium]